MPEIMLRELEFEQKKAKITLISVLFQPFIHWSGHTDCLRALLTTEILPIFIIGNVRKRWIYLDRLKFAINFFSLHVLFTYVRSQRNSKLHFFLNYAQLKKSITVAQDNMEEVCLACAVLWRQRCQHVHRIAAALTQPTRSWMQDILSRTRKFSVSY